jgi:hypothetical protein
MSPDGAPMGRPRVDQPGRRGGATAATVTLSRPSSAEQRPAAPPSGPPAGPFALGGSLLSPRHWKVRTKLAAVLLVPAVAFLVLASINMAGQISSARDFGRGATIAEFGRQASTLVFELQAERDIAAGFIASGRKASNRAEIAQKTAEAARITEANAKLPEGQEGQKVPVVPAPNEGATLESQQTNVDAALTAYRTAEDALGDVGPDAQARVEAAGLQIDDLTQLRAALSGRLLTQGAIIGKYSTMIDSLLLINGRSARARQHRPDRRCRRPHRAERPQGDAVPGARAPLRRASVTGGSRFQFSQQQEFSRSWPNGGPPCSGSGPTRPRTRSSSTTRWSTARPCWRSSGWRTVSSGSGTATT